MPKAIRNTAGPRRAAATKAAIERRASEAQSCAAAQPVERGMTAPAAAPEPAPRIDSLDDVLALMMLLEPAETSDLARVSEFLQRCAAGESTPGPVAGLLRQAAELIGEVVSAQAGDPRGTLDQAGQIIEQAARLQKQPEEPAAKPGKPVPQEQPQGPCPAADDSLPEDSDPELLNEFVTESMDFIAGAEAALLSLEANPENLEAVNSVFRAFHTIKGTSGFLGLRPIAELAHRAESLLSRIRDREIECVGVYADLILQSIDALKEFMQSVRNALAGMPMARPPAYEALLEDLAHPEAVRTNQHPRTPCLGDILVAEGKATREVVESVAAQKGKDMLGVAMVKSQAVSLTDVARALRTQQAIASADRGRDASLRVRTERLDRLIDLVGELVIAQSMVAQDSMIHEIGNHELLKKVIHTGKIVRELQDLTMSMRMVPLKGAFQKMARLARDLAQKANRRVNFLAEGEDTEIDRNMVDVISEPLVHMVRNAIDHGIEDPETRAARGKPETGTVRLSAYHAGGDVVVELQDDGRGLDREKIVQKAVAEGIIDPDKSLSDHEVFNLIFAPGFSTADRITDISGRGVGMDVVKRSVDALRGRIEITSEPGSGCVFTIRLPLTLAITEGMLVKVGQERYIIPTVNIHLSLRPDRKSLFTIAGRGELVMLRGELMPLFRLHRLFGVPGAQEDPTRGLLVVVGDEGRRSALLVDELLGQQQVVAKNLGDGLGRIRGISGGAILGDGRVGLILDIPEVEEIARRAGNADRQSAA